jgi:uncharacterized protein YdhG (YjbR/CyaY superfamily)
MKNGSRAAGEDGSRQVDRYIGALAPDRRAALEKLRRTVRAAAPEALEKISYGMPVFYNPRMLVGFASFKEHMTFFVMSTAVMKTLGREFREYTSTAGGIHFTAENPLPVALVKKLVKARVQENAERDRRRRKRPGR